MLCYEGSEVGHNLILFCIVNILFHPSKYLPNLHDEINMIKFHVKKLLEYEKITSCEKVKIVFGY